MLATRDTQSSLGPRGIPAWRAEWEETHDPWVGALTLPGEGGGATHRVLLKPRPWAGKQGGDRGPDRCEGRDQGLSPVGGRRCGKQWGWRRWISGALEPREDLAHRFLPSHPRGPDPQENPGLRHMAEQGLGLWGSRASEPLSPYLESSRACPTRAVRSTWPKAGTQRPVVGLEGVTCHLVHVPRAVLPPPLPQMGCTARTAN